MSSPRSERCWKGWLRCQRLAASELRTQWMIDKLDVWAGVVYGRKLAPLTDIAMRIWYANT